MPSNKNQINNDPSAQKSSTPNTDSNPAMRSAAGSYEPIVSSAYPAISYGSYGLRPYQYEWAPESYGSRALVPGPYGLGSSSFRFGSNSYGSVGFKSDSHGSSSSSSSSETPGTVSSSYGAGEEPCEYGQYGSILNSVIPTSLAGYAPHHGGISVVKQIIHKPYITEFQDVVHKPVITEMQEILNRPVISEVEQIVHRPMYIEHIGLGPTHHEYQKHIIKKPVYQKPIRKYVHKPAVHAGTVHLADEYEHAVYKPQEPCEYGIPEPSHGSSSEGSSSNGYGSTENGGGVPSNEHYGPVAARYSSYMFPPHSSNAVVPSIPVPYRSVHPSAFEYPSLPSYKYALGPSDARTYEPVHRTLLLPKAAAERIIYDKISPYDQQVNNDFNQQYYNDVQYPSQQYSEYEQQLQQQQQQQERSSEDMKVFRIDVNAIDKKLEQNPEIRKHLIKMITESMYIDDQTTRTDKKQHDIKV